jgi:radical SAM protein with 4Fe4S-binding SPASM domain
MDGQGSPEGVSAADRSLAPDDHHPLEDWLGRRPVRWLLGRISRDRPGGTAIERILASYRNPAAPLSERVRYWPIHRFIDRMRGGVSVEEFRRRLAEHEPTVRGLVIVARSVARFGLTRPQRFTVPLFAVWNITNRCNLKCRHCYQSSDHAAAPDELDREQRLAIVDKLGRAHAPMLAVAGGEPTVCPDLLAVLERARGYGMHTTIATNGVTMTEDLAGRLAAAGVRYVEISLDSVDPARHDAFRGVPGMWERAVRGARIVAGTEGLRLGIAMCVHRGNLHEVRDMIELAIELGAGCFAHFNFIPVGRGLKMVSGDISPAEREELLATLNEYMQSGRIGVISTAPQLGRICLMHADEDGRTACSHAGSGAGTKARVVAKYLGGCGAGRTYVCIEPNGDVTPCVYLPHRVMGNLAREGLEEVFQRGGEGEGYYEMFNDRTARIHHCGRCDYANFCGGCRARSDAYFGRLDAGDPGCVFNEDQWDELVASGVISDAPAPEDPAELELPAQRHGLA